ncbi:MULTISPECIES: helix-hairpin-helix domain-containing protein [Halobacterium]|uniref:helix-hairpin-helix domain-containing protein n=1 Tax=Halobacterium TaxID=2239 RepID=UPI001962B816|nr:MULTISPECIES: helix-hairpin-helix domain-containing protein [Halobacterium]MDL0120084.1 helix-hairpin-helix domain-containing protein [Halobacterium salinarum]MDL0121442.1 helix-hairpin-helix domain-containing protein [Halobacterium salinarum]MDL0134583.1 helix-hairpin-helix domain-containing protein [Halobacterium salinarum]QRY25085.1 hypothetical protein JRZ79_01405 [Halobacterium sp. BOL4-2]
MGLLSKLKSLFGAADNDHPPGSGVDITVEHEPDATTERAVKGAESTPQTADDSQPADAEPAAGDLTDITGIGPAYASRLADAGVTTPQELAAADTDDIAAATDLSPKRIRRWRDRVGDQ